MALGQSGDDEGGASMRRAGSGRLPAGDVLGLGSFEAYYTWGPHFPCYSGSGYVAEKV